MSFFLGFLFSLTVAESLSKFFVGSTQNVSPITLLAFLIIAPASLVATHSRQGSAVSLKPELAFQCLTAVTPLIVAALIFAALQAVLSMSVSKEISSIAKIFRPIWLVGFVIIVIRNLLPIAAGF